MIKDKLYKILFAVQLALLPMLFYAEYCCKVKWAITVVVLSILATKILSELLNYNKTNNSHKTLSAIGNSLILSVVLIAFMCAHLINIALAIVVLLLNIVMNVLLLTLKNEKMPKLIESVDFCYILILCYAYFCLAFAKYYTNLATIGIIALLLIILVSIGYKIYYIFKYTDFTTKIKMAFSKRNSKKSNQK